MQITCLYDEASAVFTLVHPELTEPLEIYLPNMLFLPPPQWRLWLATFCRHEADAAGVPRDRAFLITPLARPVDASA